MVWCQWSRCFYAPLPVGEETEVHHNAIVAGLNDLVRESERIVVGDIAGLKNGTGTLSVVTNEHGGIIDDTVVTKINDQDVYIVLVSISHLPNPNTVCPYETDNFFYL